MDKKAFQRLLEEAFGTSTGMPEAEYQRLLEEAFGEKNGFAAEVIAVARKIQGQGRFGEDKVFIVAIWKEAFQDMTLDAFKAALVSAQKVMALTLSRADMAQSLDQTLVRESATRMGLDDVVHFVRT
jgi:hypothetical protein